jgi:hypothetical protein
MCACRRRNVAARSLRKAAGTCEKFVVELSCASDALLRKHGKVIADQQHVQKRIGDIDLKGA